MEKITFYSYKPYLYINLRRKREIYVTFSGNCTYTARNEVELQLLREYAEKYKASYLIVEAGGELELEDLIRLHEEWEAKLLEEQEQRQTEREQAELKRKEEHEIYSMLRGSDIVRR